MVRKFDFLVVGSGIAGMSFALKVAHKGSVALICKAGMEEANTYFAQGGIASVTNLAVDNFEKHIEDTMIAGDWISDRAAVEKVVRNAPAQIRELIQWGVNFDKKADGEYDLHREGGHSEFRILHHADDTGAEIQYRRIVHRRFVLIRSVRYKEKIGISVGIEFHRYFSFLVRRDYKFYGVLPDSSALDAIDSGTDLSRTEIFGCGHPHFQRFAEVVLGQCKRHCIP